MLFALSRRSLQAGFWLLALVLAVAIYALPATHGLPDRAGWAGLGRLAVFLAIAVALVPVAIRLYTRFPLNAEHWRGALAVQLTGAAVTAGIAQAAAAFVPLDMAAVTQVALKEQPGLHAFGLWWVAVLVCWGYRCFVAAEETETVRQLSLELVRGVADGPGPDGGQRRRFRVNARGREIDVPVEHVHWIQASGKQVILHLRDRRFRLDESMRSLEKTLDPDFFVRVHRSRMVNLDRIAEIKPWPHGDHRIVLQDGTVVNYSRRYRHRLEQPQKKTASAC